MSQLVDKRAGRREDTPKPLITITCRAARRKKVVGIIIIVVVALSIYKSCVSKTGSPVGLSGGPADSADFNNADTDGVTPRQHAEMQFSTPGVGQKENTTLESEANNSKAVITSHEPAVLHKSDNKCLLGVQIQVDDGGQSIVLIVDRNLLGPARAELLECNESGSLWLLCPDPQSEKLIGTYSSGIVRARIERDRMSVWLRLDNPLDADKLFMIMNARWRDGCILEIRLSKNPDDRIALSM